jgi:hypothetical protein
MDLATYGEALLAATGITAALEPGPIFVTMRQAQRAGALDRAIQRAVRATLRGQPWERPDAREVPAYPRLLELLGGPITDERIAENLASIDDQGAAEALGAALGRAWAYAQGIMPRRTWTTLLGAESVPPGGVEVARFRRLYQVADDPLLVLEDLARGRLSSDQVGALAAAYPGLYAEVARLVPQELAALRAERPRWQPSRALASQVRTAMRQPQDGSMQAIFASQRQAQQPGGERPAPPAVDRSQEMTSQQRIASR